MKLGKKAPRLDRRTLKLAKYLPFAPIQTPAWDWTRWLGVSDYGEMLNDNLGDCTIAAIGHGIQILTGAVGKMLTLPDSDILAAYEQWDGYVNGDPSTDQGGVMLDVQKDWRQKGLGGHFITAFGSIDPSNTDNIKRCIILFGGVNIGVQLPVSAQRQIGGVWDVVARDGGMWGGHNPWVPTFNATGPVCITWGKLQQMTWAFWNKYCDESYAAISMDFLRATGKTVTGLELSMLQDDLAEVTA